MAQNYKDKEHVNFIVEKEIRDEFTAICKDNGVTPSLVLQLFCKRVVKNSEIPFKFLLLDDDNNQ